MNTEFFEEDIIDLGENPTLHRIYDYFPYSHWQIKNILMQHYNCRLEKIWQGYKANRRKNYHEIYKIVCNDTNEVLAQKVSLDSLRHFFAHMDIPMNEQENKRNPKAQLFLEIIENL